MKETDKNQEVVETRLPTTSTPYILLSETFDRSIMQQGKDVERVEWLDLNDEP